jgi:hypothetical protein
VSNHKATNDGPDLIEPEPIGKQQHGSLIASGSALGADRTTAPGSVWRASGRHLMHA